MRKNCAGCKNLGMAKHFNGLAIPFCKAAGEAVVPHSATDIGELKCEVVFWRVPEFCVLPDDEVDKTEDRQPEKHWTTEKHSMVK